MSKCPKCGNAPSVQKLVYRSDGQNQFECPKCGHQWLNPVEVKLTNGDRIRQMSNKEMAVMFRTDIKQCPPGECHDDGCIECWLEWLNSEVKNESRR